MGWLLQAQDERKDKYYRLISSEHPRASRRPILTVIARVHTNAPAIMGSANQDVFQKKNSASLDLNVTHNSNTALPAEFSVAQNHPNPFNPETRIRYSLPVAATVTLTIYDVRGHEVRTLIERANTPAGSLSVVWDGRDNSGGLSPSGAYFYRIVLQPLTGGGKPFVKTTSMTLLK